MSERESRSQQKRDSAKGSLDSEKNWDLERKIV